MREYSFHDAFNYQHKRVLNAKESLRMQVEQLLECHTRVIVGKKQPFADRSFMHSHFGGVAYFEKNEKWPIHPNTGVPLEFVCQFVNTGEFPFPDEFTMIQLFFSFDHLFMDDIENAWFIKTYKNIHIDNFEYIPNPQQKINSVYNPVYMISDVCLPDYETAVSLNPMIHYASKKVKPRKSHLAYYDVVKALLGENDYGTALGGYPNWLYHESDFDTSCYKQGYRLLAQLDNECNAGLCWSEVGTAFLFYNQDDPQKFEFVLQRF